MAEILQITTHIEDAKDRLIEQYKEKININSLVGIFGSGIQNIEDELEKFPNARSIHDAVGAQLDLIGSIVGLDRKVGQNDDSYRADLFVQISINTAQGDPESLILLMENLANTELVKYKNLGNCNISFYIDVDIPSEEINTLYERIEKAALAGVKVSSIIKITATETFAFAGSDGGTTGKGFGDLNDSNIGGVWAELLVRT